MVTSKFGLRDWGGKGPRGGKQISDSLLVHPTHPVKHLTKLLLCAGKIQQQKKIQYAKIPNGKLGTGLSTEAQVKSPEPTKGKKKRVRCGGLCLKCQHWEDKEKDPQDLLASRLASRLGIFWSGRDPVLVKLGEQCARNKS